MPIASIYLQQSANHAVCLRGEVQNGKITVNALDLKANLSGTRSPAISEELFPFAAGEKFEFEINPNLVTKIADVADATSGAIVEQHYRFSVSDLNLTLTAGLLFAAGNKKFFGRNFSLAAGYSARLILRLIADAGLRLQPSATIEFCGRLEIALGGGEGGAVEVATAPICFEIDLEQLFEGNSNLKLPSLKIGLPDFGFKLPKMRFPWDFPSLPSFPFRLPARQFSFENFPVEVGWKSAQISENAGRIAINLTGLRISTRLHAIEGDLHLVWENDGIKVSESYFDLYRPDYQNRLRLQFDQWHSDEDCLLIGWKKGQLNNWLKLLLPDLAEIGETDADVTFRLLRASGGGGIREVRLDWKPNKIQNFRLPGITVELPSDTQYSLLYQRNEGAESVENEKLAFVVTEEATKTITARSTFAFNRGDGERELHNEGAGAKPLLELTATPNKKVSVALLDFPLSGDGSDEPVRFFRQLKNPLEVLQIQPAAPPPDSPFPPAACLPSDVRFDPLKADDWTFDLNLPAVNLPFLKNGDNQFLQVTLKPKTPQQSAFSRTLGVTLKLAKDLTIENDVEVTFDVERFSFKVKDGEGFVFKTAEEKSGDFFGLKWRFSPNREGRLFTLVTENKNYQLRQAEDSIITVEYQQVGSADESLKFELRDFVLTSGGISAKGRVLPSPVKLGGLNTKFRFTEGEFSIEENKIRDFSIAGTGALPPKLVGEAIADIALQFRANDGGNLEIGGGIARLRGKNLLDCKATRFQFAVDGLNLKFVNDGRYHFYFTVTGRAKYVPLAGDDSSGPLAWLPGIEMQLLDCPLTDDVSVLSKHVKFLVEMPKKQTFDFLGCFKMELRGIGFVPQAPMFDGDAAMEISGQIMFADSAGDVVDARIDFHSLFIGLPKPGDFFPRLHCKNLGVKVRVGDAFALEGAVEYIDGEIEPGLIAKGFGGRGSLSIQGLPTFTAAFTFIRVSRDGGNSFVRAWFIYVQAEKLSLRIPLLNVFIREIGLGFGYRYTLASIQRADELDDPRELIKELRRLSLTQGELSRRDQWRVVIENEGEDPRWTIAARLMIAQNSAASGIADWSQKAEAQIPSLFLMDAVLGIRSDLTFMLTARAWLNTNYNDYRTKESLRSRPLLSGFALLSPRKRRFLAHLASNSDAEFGDHPPLPEFLKQAIRESYFSATLLIEPGLLHYELGWANQLRWRAKLGPIEAEFRGGMIFRVSRTDIVYGNSFQARGSLELSAKAGGDSVGARISATAQVAYGARYIGVINLIKPLADSALYGAVGIEINVRFRVEFWLKLKIGFVKIKINLNFEFSVQITALVEIGFTPQHLVGARGTATVSLRIMGRGLYFKINVGVNREAVDRANQLTSQFLNIGLEAAEVEPIPGSTAPSFQPLTNGTPLAIPAGLDTPPVAEQPATDPELTAENESVELPAAPVAAASAGEFVAPNYSIFCIPVSPTESYFLLYPNEVQPRGIKKQGFLPVPPAHGIDVEDQNFKDFEWNFPAPGGNVRLAHFNPIIDEWDSISDSNNPHEWKAHWKQEMGEYQLKDGEPKKVFLETLLRKAFLTKEPEIPLDDPAYFDRVEPVSDPELPFGISENTLEDARVQNPSDAAFEAAVRGAAEQFEGSPYFKRDENSLYESNLANAFSPDTSIYSPNGQNQENAEKAEQALHLRSMVVNQMLTDLQKYVENPMAFDPTRSIAFQTGLVFKTEGGIPEWLNNPVTGGTIKQRIRPDATKPPDDLPDASERTVEIFNTATTNFETSVPQFQRVRQYTDADTIAVAWDLEWTEEIKTTLLTEHEAAGQREAEQFLRHYLVRRRALNGGEREAEFKIKPVEALNLPIVKAEMIVSVAEQSIFCETGGLQIFQPNQQVRIFGLTGGVKTVRIRREPQAVTPTKIKFVPDSFGTNEQKELLVNALEVLRLKSRFQFTDNFNDEPLEDQAALAREGKSYVYTIIPVDVTGKHSPRPLTILATRRANYPPNVPADGELKIEYKLKFNPEAEADNEQENDFLHVKKPKVLQPAENGIVLQWTKPPDAQNQPRVVIRNYRLILRREKTLPIGSYGLDAENEGNRSDGLPSGSAYALRTDVVVIIKNDKLEIDEDVNLATKQKIIRTKIDLVKKLRDAGVLPKAEESWRPEAWRVFLQTESAGGVFSALTPVKIVLRFKPQTPQSLAEIPPLERQPPLLEWIARPLAWQMLAPEDEKADVDFAAFPMPKRAENNGAIDGNLADLLEFETHPDRLRAIRLRWNQSPSERRDYPTNLQAGYQIFEFDLDAHTADAIENPQPDFLEKMRRVQEAELLPPAALRLTPDTAAVADQWEAWYPSAVRRRFLREELLDERDEVAKIPPKFSNAKLSPWLSWRESFLEWAADERIVTGKISIDGETQILTVRQTAFDKQNIFKEGTFVRIVGLPAAENNGIKQLDLNQSGLEKNELRFALNSFPKVPAILKKAMKIAVPAQIVELAAGDAFEKEKLQPGAFVFVKGAANEANNGFKQIAFDQNGEDNQPLPPNKLRFANNSFAADEPAADNSPPTLTFFTVFQAALDAFHGVLSEDSETATATTGASPAGDEIKSAHLARQLKIFNPFLARLLNELDGAKFEGDEIIVELNPLPIVKTDNLELLQKQTSPPQDPYGWNTLKLLGLSVAFALRRERTGEVLAPDDAQKTVREKLRKLQTDEPDLWNKIERNLFVEFLFQPGRSVRLKTEMTEPKAEDLLSLVQISLRPAIRQHYRYYVCKVRGESNKPKDVTINLSPDTVCEFIELTRNAARRVLRNVENKTEIVVPASGTGILLFRSASNTPPVIPNQTLIEFLPTDWLSLNFDAPLDQWQENFENHETIAAAWQRFACYLLRLNSLGGADTIEMPTPGKSSEISAMLAWLDRFFEASGDFAPDEQKRAHTTGGFATAYPRVMSPVSLAPDAAGRLTYYHRVEDQWAHVYRYYFLSQHRYDRLWQALANSDALFPKFKPDTKIWFEPPRAQAGGLDVVLDRIKEIAAPLILFSGRLDRKTGEAQLPAPGKTWEVIIAKHPEQLLVERNRTLVRQLDYRHTAHTLLRRFAFTAALEKLEIELRRQQSSVLDKVIYTPATTSSPPPLLPGAIDKPDHLALDKLGELGADERLSLDLPSRLGVFGKDAVVLQWEAMPFFYEHLLLVVGQTSTQVSPVTAVVQREFEYVTPQPEAKYEVCDLPDGERGLQLQIRLRTYWESMPPENVSNARTQWAGEKPEDGDAHLKFAALPDLDVIYQIVLESAGGNTEAQAEFFYNLADKPQMPELATHYEAKQFGSQFRARAIRVKPPEKIESGKSKTFFLLAGLSKINIVRLPNRGSVSLANGDFTLSLYVAKLRELFTNLEKLIAPNAAPKEIKYVLRRFVAVAVVSNSVMVPEEMKDKLEISRTATETLLLARSTLNSAERERLRLSFANQSDREAIEQFNRDLEDRQAFDEIFRDWTSAQPISSRRDFAVNAVESDRVEFSAPMSCAFELDVEGATQAEIEAARTGLAQFLLAPSDHSFAEAVRQIIERIDARDAEQPRQETIFTAEACVGLEQIEELAPAGIAGLDAQNRKIVWRGAIRPAESDALKRWTEVSDFHRTFQKLLDAADAKTLEFRFRNPNPPIPFDQFNSMFPNRLRVEATDDPNFLKIVWTGLKLNYKEERALIELRDGVGDDNGGDIRAAVGELLKALLSPVPTELETIEVGIVETNWQPRPRQNNLPDELKNRLLVGNGLIRFYGWMTRDEAKNMRSNQTLANQSAIGRLYQNSLMRGTGDARMKIVARRGAANNQSARIGGLPLEEKL